MRQIIEGYDVKSAADLQEALAVTVGETESVKLWLSVLNELKSRGVRDVFMLCADGLTGIKEAIEAAYPQTEYQRCILCMWYATRSNAWRTRTGRRSQFSQTV